MLCPQACYRTPPPLDMPYGVARLLTETVVLLSDIRAFLREEEAGPEVPKTDDKGLSNAKRSYKLAR